MFFLLMLMLVLGFVVIGGYVDIAEIIDVVTVFVVHGVVDAVFAVADDSTVLGFDRHLCIGADAGVD